MPRNTDLSGGHGGFGTLLFGNTAADRIVAIALFVTLCRHCPCSTRKGVAISLSLMVQSSVDPGSA